MNVEEMDGAAAMGQRVRGGNVGYITHIHIHRYVLLYIFKCVPGIKRVLWTVVLSIPPPTVVLLARVLACACACAVPRPRCVHTLGRPVRRTDRHHNGGRAVIIIDRRERCSSSNNNIVCGVYATAE